LWANANLLQLVEDENGGRSAECGGWKKKKEFGLDTNVINIFLAQAAEEAF